MRKKMTNKDWNNVSKTKPCMFCRAEIPVGLGFNSGKYHKRNCPLSDWGKSKIHFPIPAVFERMSKNKKGRRISN